MYFNFIYVFVHVYICELSNWFEMPAGKCTKKGHKGRKTKEEEQVPKLFLMVRLWCIIIIHSYHIIYNITCTKSNNNKT